MREPQAVQLVARSTDNALEIDKTWELMSELDKDELIQKKIELIVAAILNKNLKFVRQFEEVDSNLKQLSQRIQHTKKQLDILKIHLSLEKCGACYKIDSSENRSNYSLASLIADAILREPEAVQLVAYCPDNCLEIDKTWELMSELDKDALIWKKIVRDL